MRLTLARDLKAGSRMRTEDGFRMIESVESDPSTWVTGGRKKKSAVAIKITLHGGEVHFAHPGDELISD